MSAFISTLDSWAGNLILIGLGIFCLYTLVLWVFFPDRDWKKWMTLEECWVANSSCKYACCAVNAINVDHDTFVNMVTKIAMTTDAFITATSVILAYIEPKELTRIGC